MIKYEKEFYYNIKRIADNLEKIAIALEKPKDLSLNKIFNEI